MRVPLFGRRLTSTCRILPIALVLASLSHPAAAEAAAITGVVVDQSQRPVPHARVVLLSDTSELTTTTSDEAGRFAFPDVQDPGCRLEARLTGFKVAVLPCSTPSPLRVTLAVAPVAEAIVVTPTRSEAPASQAGMAVTTFTAEDLERRRDALVTDLLRTTPGAMVIQSGGPGSVATLFVRGGESNYNKVLLDGIPLNEPGGTFDFSNITTQGLERVEIVRGAQSALFGSDAMASVVQLFTRRADRSDTRPHVTANLEAGGYGTMQAEASIAQNTGAGDFSLGVARLRTDNLGKNSDFENTSLSGNAGWSLGGSATLRVIGRAELGRAGAPGQTAYGRPDLDAYSDRHALIGGVTFSQELTTAVRQQASYSVAYSRQGSKNLRADPPYTPAFDGHVAPFEFDDFPYDFTTRLRRHHASYQLDVRLPRAADADQLTTLLVDWDGERATIEDGFADSATKGSRGNVGVSLQHQALWRRVFVTASARLEHNASFGTAAAPRGSLVYVVHPATGPLGETRAHVSGGLGIKEPTVLQTFSPPPFEGNADLKPERSRTAEIGIDQRLASDRVRIEAIWFANRFRNIVSTRTLGFSPFHAQYVNVGLTRARGAELGLDVAATAALRARVGYTYLDSEVLESTSPFNEVFQVGAELFRRPKHSGFIGVSFSRDRLTLDVTGTLVGRYVDSDFSSLEPPIIENPGRKTWDARASYTVTPHVTVLGSVDNVTDEDYMEPLGYKTLGRVARIGLRAAF